MSLVFIETPRLEGDSKCSMATTGRGTKVTLQSGEKIPEIKSIDLRIAHDEVIKANITLHAAFRGTAEAHFFVVDPRTKREVRETPLLSLAKEVAKIVFVDGTEWSPE